MKNKFLKIIGLFYLIFMVSGCEEDFETQEETFQVEPKFKISNVDRKDLENNIELKDNINAIRERNRNLSNVGNKNLYSSQHNFIIATDYGKYIENQDGSYHSYTFPIIDNDSLYTKNLLMSLNDSQSYDSYIISYDIGVMDLLSIGDNNLENAVSIEPIQLDINQSEVFNKQTIDRICITILGDPYCSYYNDDHDGGTVNGQNCPGHTIDEKTECYDLESGSGPGGPGSIDPNSGQDPSSPGDTGNQNNNPIDQTGLGGSGEENVTIHIPDCGGEKCSDALISLTNCQNLKQQSQDFDFTNKLKDLRDNMLPNNETGYVQVPADTTATSFNYTPIQGTNGQSIDITITPGLISGFFHTHYDVENQLSVFSLSDIWSLYELAINGNIFDDTFTLVLITAHGTKYALKFADPQALVDFGDEWFSDWGVDTSSIPNYVNKQDEIENRFYEMGIKPRNPNKNHKNEKKFAKFLNNYNMGLELFKSNNDFTQWEKVNPDGTTTPCN